MSSLLRRDCPSLHQAAFSELAQLNRIAKMSIAFRCESTATLYQPASVPLTHQTSHPVKTRRSSRTDLYPPEAQAIANETRYLKLTTRLIRENLINCTGGQLDI